MDKELITFDKVKLRKHILNEVEKEDITASSAIYVWIEDNRERSGHFRKPK